jgi:penicillin-binding protein 2
VVIEHGMGGARAGAPVAKDVLTWLFDREQATKRLAELEAGWGGDIATRMAKKAEAFNAARAAAKAAPPPPPPEDAAAAASNVAAEAANANAPVGDGAFRNEGVAE